MKKDTFSNRLKIAMNLRNIKQIDIANKTNISKSLINKYIFGIAEPKNENLLKIAKLLEVDETWLMGYDVPMDRKNKYILEKTQEIFDNSKLMNYIIKYAENEEQRTLLMNCYMLNGKYRTMANNIIQSIWEQQNEEMNKLNNKNEN